MFKIIILLILLPIEFSFAQSQETNILSKEWYPILKNGSLGNKFYEKTLIKIDLNLDLISYKIENKEEKFFKIKSEEEKMENDERVYIFHLDDDEFKVALIINGQVIFYSDDNQGIRFAELVPLD